MGQVPGPGQVLMRWQRACGPGRIAYVTLAYLVQHGEKERLPGDPGLTPMGRRQAMYTGRWLRGQAVRALYTSPSRRAWETAECISSVTGVAARPDARLRERLNWDGSEPLDTFLALWARTTQDRDFVPAKGDSSRQAGARLQAFLAHLPDGPGPVAVVTHGGITADLLRTVLGDDALGSSPPAQSHIGFAYQGPASAASGWAGLSCDRRGDRRDLPIARAAQSARYTE
jgi:broad specificity phosphatase PhoE